jgi:hypothetical protein
MEEVLMDSRGRVTIGKELAKKYGRRFIVVPMYNDIVLVPKPKDPIKALAELGKKSDIGKFSIGEIRKMAEKEAVKEAMKSVR